MSQWDFISKFILVGDSSVGKSSLLVRLTEQRFLADSDPTIGVEFGSHLIPLGDGEGAETIKVQIWDTAGSESFRSITRSYYRGAAGALLVYSVTHRASFLAAKEWLDDVRSHAEEGVSVVLVGNQVDLCDNDDEEEGQQGVAAEAETDGEVNSLSRSSSHREADTSTASTPPPPVRRRYKRRQVSTQEAQAFADEEGLMFVETSAKTGAGVTEAFTRAARDVHAKFLARYESNDADSSGGLGGGGAGANNGAGSTGTMQRRRGRHGHGHASEGSVSLAQGQVPGASEGRAGKDACCVIA